MPSYNTKKNKKPKVYGYGRYGQKGFEWDSRPQFRCYTYRSETDAALRRMTGAANLARQWYYPKWKYQPPSADEKRPPTGAIRQSPEEAKKLGSRVDRELVRWVQTKKKPPKAHRYTRYLIEAFHRRKWTPIASQNIVGIPEAKLATQFDILFKNEKDELVLTDVKTGYESHWDVCHDQKLEPPLNLVPSSAHTHSWLQLALTAISFTASNFKKCKKRPIKHLHLVRVHAGGVDFDPLPLYMPHLLKDLSQRLIERST